MNCEVLRPKYSEHTEVKVPHKRKSTFRSLTHEENGFLGNRWKDQATRWNQLRFHNEVFLNHELMKNDGLSNLKFTIYGKEYRGKITQVNVGI